jgi:hypothetical protein
MKWILRTGILFLAAGIVIGLTILLTQNQSAAFQGEGFPEAGQGAFERQRPGGELAEGGLRSGDGQGFGVRSGRGEHGGNWAELVRVLLIILVITLIYAAADSAWQASKRRQKARPTSM